MSEGVYIAARRIRPYLPELAPEDHDTVDAELSTLLNDPQQADTEPRLVALLTQRPATGMFMDAVLDDAPRYRPRKVVEEGLRIANSREAAVREAAGYSGLAGSIDPPDEDWFCCPKGDYEWARFEAATPVPECSTHRVPLQPCWAGGMVLGAFWKSASGTLVDRWAEFGSAIVFWAGLLGIWLWAHGGWVTARQGSSWLEAQSDLGLFGVLLAGLLLAAAPAVVVARVTTPVLRLLEGYWPAWARAFWDSRVAEQQKKRAEQEAQRLQLAQARRAARRKGTHLPRGEQEDYARLEWSLHHEPLAERMMPTRVGNVLRAAEDRPRTRYGLDSVIVWPRLWLVLPDNARQELIAARSSLDSSVTAVIWGVLFAAGAPVAAFAGSADNPLIPTLVGVATGIAVAIAATVWWVPNRAIVFSDLLDSAFDLYRFGLYEQSRWAPPTDPTVEKSVGMALTKYLWRGATTADATFVHDKQGDRGD